MTERTNGTRRGPLEGLAPRGEAPGLSAPQPAAIVELQGDATEAEALLEPGDLLLHDGGDRRLAVSESMEATALLGALRRHCPGVPASDRSHAWCRIVLTHPRAVEIVQGGTTAILARDAVTGAATAFRGIPVIVHSHAADRVAVYVPRSYARCLWAWLADAVEGG